MISNDAFRMQAGRIQAVLPRYRLRSSNESQAILGPVGSGHTKVVSRPQHITPPLHKLFQCALYFPKQKVATGEACRINKES
jgi:hypothetical protein